MTTLLRTSERSTYKQCRQRWWWAYEDQLRQRTTAPALVFGDLTHQALAAYYKPGRKRGPRPSATFAALYQELGDFTIRDEKQDWVDALDLGVAVLDHYVEHWGAESDLEIIAPEMPFKFKMTDIGGEPFWYVGRFDGLAYLLDVQEFVLLEHKTAQTIDTSHLALDEQAGAYWAFAPEWVTHLINEGLVKKRRGLDMDFIMYNFLRKAARDPRKRDDEGRYLNKDGKISKVQPAPYFQRVKVYRSAEDRVSVMKRIRQEAWEMRMVREGKLPVYKNPSSSYPDRHCTSCPFYEICELEETGSDWRSVADSMYDRMDQYAEYRADLGLEDE